MLTKKRGLDRAAAQDDEAGGAVSRFAVAGAGGHGRSAGSRGSERLESRGRGNQATAARGLVRQIVSTDTAKVHDIIRAIKPATAAGPIPS